MHWGKIMTKRFKFFCGSTFSLAFVLSIFNMGFTAAKDTGLQEEPANLVSMIQLLIRPELFADRKVEVFGYFWGYPTQKLHLTKAHAEALDTMSSVSLAVPELGPEITDLPNCSGHYVYVTAEVKIEPLIAYSLVTLVNVESIKIADGPKGDKFQICYEAQP